MTRDPSRPGARAFRLDVRAGWWVQPSLTSAITVSDAIRLRSPSEEPRPLNDPAGTFGGLADPTGVAIDADCRVYVVDPAIPDVLRWEPCPPDAAPGSGALQPSAAGWELLPCFGGAGSAPRQLDSPSGLVVTPAGDLVIADTGNHRLQVVALKGLVLRRLIGAAAGAPPAQANWTPCDLAVLPGAAGCPWRLAVSDPTGGYVYVFGPDFRFLAAWGPFDKPRHLAVDKSGRLYVTQAGAEVVVLAPDGTAQLPVTTTAGRKDAFPPVSVVLVNGKPRLRCALPPSTPVRAKTGTVVLGPFDSRMPGCVWHRVTLVGELVPGTNVAVATLTSEGDLAPDGVAAAPASRWRGGQVHGVVGSDPWDCLVLSPPGRKLWLRLTFSGDGHATPEISSVLVEYPRAGSIRFLPAPYREEPTSADFLARLLSILDTTKETVDTQIAAMPRLFDPYAVPAGEGGDPDLLAWVSGWLGLVGDGRLPTDRRRRLLAQAHNLHRLRGTPAGVKLHVEVVTGRSVRLLEDFKLRRWLWLDGSALGERSVLWGTDIVARMQLDTGQEMGTVALVGATDPLRDPFHVHAHRFTVLVPGTGDPDEDALLRSLAERAIELAKPAHTQGRVDLVQARLRVGISSYIGVDSVIGAYPSKTVAGQGRLGRDTVMGGGATGAGSPTPRVGDTTRIGSTTLLD
jgi:phage tail-like protein